MKSIFKEFIEIFGSFLLILALMFASFLLIINYNHYNETNRKENINIKENVKYNEYLTILDNSNKNINSVNINKINTSKEKNEATVITNLYNECKIILDKSKISELKTKSIIGMKDIYNINNELYENINNKCLFYFPYTVDETIKDEEFAIIKDEIFSDRTYLLTSTEFLMNNMLSNSSYYYNSLSTNTSIYNDINEKLDVTIENYIILANSINKISTWYVSQYGGAE